MPGVSASAKVSGERFPKRARLLKHADFDRVYRQGRRHVSANMSVFFLNTPPSAARPEGARIGISTGRALGGAVTRNRIKRRVREAVRRHRAQLGAAVDVVINPRKSAGSIEFVHLEKEVARAFAQIARHASQVRPEEERR